MAPKTMASAKKPQSPLKQGKLGFKATKRGAASSSKAKAKSNELKKKKKAAAEAESESENDSVVVMEDSGSPEQDIPIKELDTADKAREYAKYHVYAQEEMGWINPIHAKGQTKIHHMLRVFDTTYAYGPCVGMTRLQRWERAAALGLDPPVEVRDILLTRQGRENENLANPVFHG